MSNNQQIFEHWLEGKISAEHCAQQLQHDPLWYSRLQNALAVQADARIPQFDAMPAADSSALFASQWQRPAAKRSWWPQVSLALSCAAMLISLSPAQLRLQNGSLTLSWHNSQAEVEAAVSSALTAYQQQQQQWLAQQLDFQQQNTSSQLVLLKDYLQDELKRDQRSDMLQLVEYLNQQRQSDWQYWQENYQPMQAGYRPANSYYLTPTDSGVVKP
ncbi:hypothetical protein MN202_16015 [Rheinheimera muenzenbergensis]|uniref:Anti sigma-E protein RseA, N-terminal domain n=1 Tax=Rheinheimera muenzenbergensis TaxID=1193628 RepID=A0ABU8CA83_9GAMM